MIDIADVPFSKVPEEEQKQFTSKIKEVGSYKGYKHRQFWVRHFSISYCAESADAHSLIRSDCGQWCP